IARQPQPFDPTAPTQGFRDETKRLMWLTSVVVAAAFLICFLIEGVTTPPMIPGRAFRYQLESKPAFLSEPLAVAKAWEALQESGVKKADLEMMVRGTNPTEAPNGRWDEYIWRANPTMGVVEF